MKRLLKTTAATILCFELAFAQTTIMQLTPGKSLRKDAELILGVPVTQVSETLSEYKPKQLGQKLYIQYAAESDLIERIEVVLEQPAERRALIGVIGLGQKADAEKWDIKGRLEECFGHGNFVVLTHKGPDAASPVVRIGYYSSDLFAVVLAKPTGTPMKAAPPTLSEKKAANNSPPKIFEDVDLLIPKGNKVQEKSVRLLLDGSSLIIDADKGETIYKTFPYASIVSAEYSYSTKPRWKTAIGATLLIGVFALPIFFMKSKQHWLTIRTDKDFAVLRLDKGNYKVILPTIDTSIGKKVEIVANEK